MKNLRIERPEWLDDPNLQARIGIGFIDNWFDTYVEPINKMLEGAVEVYGVDCKNEGTVYGSTIWSSFQSTEDKKIDTHKALLINIEPIKKDTAEDVLRDILEEDANPTTPNRIPIEYRERAKAVLEKD